MLSLTVMDIIKASLRAIKVIAPHESIDSDQAKTARGALNIMLASWATQGLTVPVMTRETFTLANGTASYTWGTGGTFNSERPNMVIDDAFVTDGSYDYPVRLIGDAAYNLIADKTTAGTPDRFMVRSTFTTSRATVYFYPVPDAAYPFTVSSQKLFTEYTGLTTTISLPPEYYAAIKWNLAIDLCPDYEREAPQTVVVLAEKTFTALQTMNAANRLEPVRLDLGLEKSNLPLSEATFMSGDF